MPSPCTSGPALFGAGRHDAAGCPASGRAAAPARLAGPQVAANVRMSMLVCGFGRECLCTSVCVICSESVQQPVGRNFLTKQNTCLLSEFNEACVCVCARARARARTCEYVCVRERMCACHDCDKKKSNVRAKAKYIDAY